MQDADNDNGTETPRRLSPAAERALKEAEERRQQQESFNCRRKQAAAVVPNPFVSVIMK